METTSAQDASRATNVERVRSSGGAVRSERSRVIEARIGPREAYVDRHRARAIALEAERRPALRVAARRQASPSSPTSATAEGRAAGSTARHRNTTAPIARASTLRASSMTGMVNAPPDIAVKMGGTANGW